MRHAKNIYQAAKTGGGDLDMNPTLRLAIDKAKADNMPNDNIDRAVKKATGTLDGANFEEVTYEGYGPGGAALIIHALTDNKNRTASEVRTAFKKNGGNLGESGSVAFMFDRKGYIVIENENGEIDEDEMTLEALEAGAEDISVADGVYEIYTDPNTYQEVYNHLNENEYHIVDGEVTLFPQNYNRLSEDDEQKMQNLIEALEESDDVQDIHHNLEESD